MNDELLIINPEQSIEMARDQQTKKDIKVKTKKEKSADRLAKKIVKNLNKKGKVKLNTRVRAGRFGILSTRQDEDVYHRAGEKITANSGAEVEFVVHREAGYDNPVVDTVKVTKVNGEQVQEVDTKSMVGYTKTHTTYPPKSTDESE